MVTVSDLKGYSFKDYSLLTRYTPSNASLGSANLETVLGGVKLEIPFLSAAMTSVTGYHLAMALGREGGMPVLPLRMNEDEKVKTITDMKNYSASFVEDPVTARSDEHIAAVVDKLKEHGHSKIPIVNKNNQYIGMFDYNRFVENGGAMNVPVGQYLAPEDRVLKSVNTSLEVEEAKELLSGSGSRYLVVVDENNHLVKMFFDRDTRPMRIGAAISSHSGWQDSALRYIDAGVDMIFVDTSDAYNGFVKNVVKSFKALDIVRERKVPICVGNFITYNGVTDAFEWGADVVKIGMSTGGACTTAKEKATGRAAMTALLEADRARQDFLTRFKQYRSIICDGGIEDTADMIIALTCADAIMMGRHFAQFYEASSAKLDENRAEIDPVIFPHKVIEEVMYYGEGSLKAMNLDRYGHGGFRTFFPEGACGYAKYRGHMKPCLREDLKRIKGAMVQNVGVLNLADYRENAVIELLSSEATRVVKGTHGIELEKR